MATSSATAITDQAGDTFNSPLINNGFVPPNYSGGTGLGLGSGNTLIYAVAGVITLLLILKMVK